jgi:hypothetical protein
VAYHRPPVRTFYRRREQLFDIEFSCAGANGKRVSYVCTAPTSNDLEAREQSHGTSGVVVDRSLCHLLEEVPSCFSVSSTIIGSELLPRIR